MLGLGSVLRAWWYPPQGISQENILLYSGSFPFVHHTRSLVDDSFVLDR